MRGGLTSATGPNSIGFAWARINADNMLDGSGELPLDLLSGTNYRMFGIATNNNDHETGYLMGFDVAFDISEISQVPIPGAIWLLGSGLIVMVGIRRRG